MQLLGVFGKVHKVINTKYLVFSLFFFFATISFSQEIMQDTGIKKEILKEGKDERKPKVGDEVKVKILGTLENGEEFESGVMTFVVGDKNMIAGFNKVLPTMKKGEKAKCTFPPEMGYGDKEQKDGDIVLIPKNSTLIFEIQLITIY